MIDIDPGIAFGTGTHETTKLCIQALSRTGCQGKRILDVGCGSGILAISALKLGASYATATDIDETAVEVARENMLVNHISPESYQLFAGDLTGNVASDHSYTFHAPANTTPIRERIGGRYDIIVANILADVIIPLSSVLHPHLKEGGIFISSGIINTKADEVEAALRQNHFQILSKETLKEWVCFIAS